MIDPNKNFRKRMRYTSAFILLAGIAFDIFLYSLTQLYLPAGVIYALFLGALFLSLGDVSGIRYMELTPIGIKQRYLFWKKQIPWDAFSQIGAQALGSRMGKEYIHSLVFIQKEDRSMRVSELFSPSHAFTSKLICPDTATAREWILRYYGPLDFDIPCQQQ